MIINEFYIEGAKIIVDDSYMVKTEDERRQRYEIFNQIGCEIMYNSIN